MGLGMSAFGGKADVNHCVAESPLLAISGHTAARPKSKIGCTEGGPARSVRHLSACGGGDSTAAVRRNPATDRRPATTARADMTSCVIAAAGLMRRVPGSRHLPNERLQIPDCTLTWSRMHRAAHPKPPDRDEWPRFQSILDNAIIGGIVVFEYQRRQTTPTVDLIIFKPEKKEFGSVIIHPNHRRR